MSNKKGIGTIFFADRNTGRDKLRRNRILLIGINKYKYLPELQYPINDCRRFFDLLKENYGFNDQDLIQSLYDENATAEVIFDELYRLLEPDESGKPRITNKDNLIIYFSGHGHYDLSLDEGYWASVEAPMPNRPADLRKLVSVSEVIKILSQVRAHHIVLIVDACFSKKFAEMEVEIPSDVDRMEFPEEIPSRYVLTAGRLEPVLDKSPFAETLQQVLKENNRPKTSIHWVGAEVMQRVSENTTQKPWCGTLVGKKYEGGEFFFHRANYENLDHYLTFPTPNIRKLSEYLHKGTVSHFDRLRNGRFKLLRIEKLLLTSTNVPELIDTHVKSGEEETPLHQAIKSLWTKEKMHAIVLGEGGMGKTVSLFRLWEDLLTTPAGTLSYTSTIPIFVALNEYNAAVGSEKHEFILRSIVRNCGIVDTLTDEWKNTLWDIFKAPSQDGSPRILLLIDGFNEVTVKKDQLLLELNRLAEQAKGVQMIITSRYIGIQNFTWAQHSKIIELLPLPAQKIESYLGKIGLPMPGSEGLKNLIKNPMMLTLYAGSSSIALNYEKDKRFSFLSITSYGELLWNFNEAQLAKQLEDCLYDSDEQIWHLFLLRCLVPYLAYRMEEEGQFFIANRKALSPSFNFKTLLDEAFTKLNRNELTEVFPELEGKRLLLGLGDPINIEAKELRSFKVRQYLVEKLNLLVIEDEVIRFVHQSFRDFFAACHLINIGKISSVEKKLPSDWKKRQLPLYLKELISELEGEHYIKPELCEKKNELRLPLRNNTIQGLLNLCRKVTDPNRVGYMVSNLVEIMIIGRKTLAGSNLSNLILYDIPFFNVSLSTHFKLNYLPAKLDGSYIKPDQFYSNAHSGSIIYICCNPERNLFITSAEDMEIKFWSWKNGTHLYDYPRLYSQISFLAFASSGHKFISLTKNQNLREWSVHKKGYNRSFENIIKAIVNFGEDRFFIFTANGKLYEVDDKKREIKIKSKFKPYVHFHKNKIVFSDEGNNILEYRTERNEKTDTIELVKVLNEFRGHNEEICDLKYSADGKKILSASIDGDICEWSTLNGQCLRCHVTNTIISSVKYLRNGKEIAAIGEDNTILFWSVKTGVLLKQITLPDEVTFIDCSEDGERVIYGDNQGSINEIYTESKRLRIQIKGKKRTSVNSVTYSKQRQTIISGSSDGRLREWHVPTLKCIQVIEAHEERINSIKLNDRENIILSGSEDGAVKEFSLENGQCVELYLGPMSIVNDVEYNKKYTSILSASNQGMIFEWSRLNRKRNNIYIGHDHPVKLARFMDETGRFISISTDGVINIWAKNLLTPLKTRMFFSLHTNCIVFSKDSESFLLGSDDGVIKEITIPELNYIKSLKASKLIDHASTNYLDLDVKKNILLSASSNGKIEEWSIVDNARIQYFKYRAIPLECHYINNYNKILACYDNGRIRVINKKKPRNYEINILNELGVPLQAVDFRQLSTLNLFSEKQKKQLSYSGAIFKDEDELQLKQAVSKINES